MSRLTSWLREPDIIIIMEPITYDSTRYDEDITIPSGFACDGATAAPNVGDGWKYHDWLFYHGKFDSGTRCSFTQANMVIYDCMRDEGRWFAARLYLLGVFTPWSRNAWKDHRASEIRKINYEQFKHTL